MNIKLNNTGKNPMLRTMILINVIYKDHKINFRECKMNTSTSAIQGPKTTAYASATAHNTSQAKTLASLMLAAGVAALVVMADQMIDSWADTHVVAAWLALWAVAALAIGLLRGVTRLLAQNLMGGLDAWSARLARRRADQRLWAMAQTDPRLMSDLQTAMDRSSQETTPVQDFEMPITRRAKRLVRDPLYYI